MHHVWRGLSEKLAFHIVKCARQEQLHVLVVFCHAAWWVSLARESKFHHWLVRVREWVLGWEHERIELVHGVMNAQWLSCVRMALCASRCARGIGRIPGLHVQGHKVVKGRGETSILEANGRVDRHLLHCAGGEARCVAGGGDLAAAGKVGRLS